MVEDAAPPMAAPHLPPRVPSSNLTPMSPLTVFRDRWEEMKVPFTDQPRNSAQPFRKPAARNCKERSKPAVNSCDLYLAQCRQYLLLVSVQPPRTRSQPHVPGQRMPRPL